MNKGNGKFLVMGSLNYDYIYALDHIVSEGETEAAEDVEAVCGGKGLNQAIALAKAGAVVYQGGMLGEDGAMLRETLQQNEVNTEFLKNVQGRNGHAFIQVDSTGKNAIVLFGGSNRKLTNEQIQETLQSFSNEDYLVLQNEINDVEKVINAGYQRGMKIVLNPSPYEEKIRSWPLSKINIFFVNEIEGRQLTGEKEPERIVNRMNEAFPHAEVILTLGTKGACYSHGKARLFQPAFRIKTVDTTAAGDTFTGFFLAAKARGENPAKCMEIAAKAAAIAATGKGAAPSIPLWEEVQKIQLNVYYEDIK